MKRKKLIKKYREQLEFNLNNVQYGALYIGRVMVLQDVLKDLGYDPVFKFIPCSDKE